MPKLKTQPKRRGREKKINFNLEKESRNHSLVLNHWYKGRRKKKGTITNRKKK